MHPVPAPIQYTILPIQSTNENSERLLALENTKKKTQLAHTLTHNATMWNAVIDSFFFFCYGWGQDRTVIVRFSTLFFRVRFELGAAWASWAVAL